jgi:hypothetical protein
MIGAIPAMQSGLGAVRSGSARLDAAAASASTAFLPWEGPRPGDQDLVGALVEMTLARRQVEIGSRIVAHASRVHQETLDILA